MDILKSAQAGTLESNDIMVMVAPAEKGSGIVIELDSIVLAQYGKAIRQVLTATAVEQRIADIYIKAVDRGALDCTIRARLLAALKRGGAAPEGEIV
jgi:citrate lyase subunit gamma (acyl carrier protein)